MEDKKYSFSREEKRSYVRWRKWMEIGEKTGCHQKAERSFTWKGYQFPICARCTGVVLGYLIAPLVYLKKGFCKTAAGLGCLAMLLDWTLQQSKVKESTNRRRLVTGIAGGFGLMSLQIYIALQLVKRLKM